MRVNALMYHDIVDGDGEASGFRGPGPMRYKLSVQAFLEHLDDLDRVTGHAPVSIDEVIRGAAPSGSWLLTFDDGGASALDTAQLLARRGWLGHFFIVTDQLGRPGFMGREDVRAVSEMGHIVGSHSSSHPARISACPPSRLLEEWGRSVEILSDVIGAPVISGSVPGGHYSAAVGRAAATVGLRALFASHPLSRVDAVDGCLLLGRYAVRRHTGAAEAAHAARGDRRRWASQRAAWTARSVLKAIGGSRYERLRAHVLGSRVSGRRSVR